MFESKNISLPRPAPYPRWLGDIGGTNARFGWQACEGAEITQVQVFPCAAYASLYDAAQAYADYLKQYAIPVPACAAFGIATAVTGDAVAMTNHPWAFSVDALRQRLGLARLVLLNDFTALALSLPHLPPEHRQQVGGGVAVPDCAIGLIGPGTGLGVSGLLPVGLPNQWIPIAGEGGHASLSADNPLEVEVMAYFQRRYGHASAERVVSGAGLVDLFYALGGDATQPITPAEVMQQALNDSTTLASQALDMFCGFLGSMAGNLALTLGARGGVYIGGGIVPRMGERFAQSPFRARFEEKGRCKAYLHGIPVWVIHSPVSPALQGASQALALALRS